MKIAIQEGGTSASILTDGADGAALTVTGRPNAIDALARALRLPIVALAIEHEMDARGVKRELFVSDDLGPAKAEKPKSKH